MPNFREVLAQKKFVITAEIAPPHGTNIVRTIARTEALREYVDAVNITDNQRAMMRLSPLALAHFLIERGIPPIMQITARDRNRLALQSELLSAYALGVRDVLVLTGDAVCAGDYPEAKGVFDLDAVTLLQTAKNLNLGIDLKGKPLEGKTDFLLGAALNPVAEPLELQLFQMERKIKAGARFFQTQLIFAPEVLRNFLRRAREMMNLREIKILAGIFPLKNAEQAEFLNARVPGVDISPALIARLRQAGEPVREGIDIATEIIMAVRDFCDGIHLMAMNNQELMLRLLAKISKIN